MISYSPTSPPRLDPQLRRAIEEMAKRRLSLTKANGQQTTLPGHDLSWRDWLNRYFADVAPFDPSAEFHTPFWEWIDAIRPGESCRPFVACVFRGAGKSTTWELGAVRVGVKLSRRFALVVAETQDQADERVQAVRTLFESIGVGAALTKQGHSRGWRRDELRTENGFNVAGIGLDVAVRGIKFDAYRPDWIAFDDCDNREDTPRATDKKERAITQSILKAGSRDVVVSFAQNLIHADSIMARVIGTPGASKRADYLLDAIRIGPVNGIEGLRIEQAATTDGTLRWKIADGRATWPGFSIPIAEADLNRVGRTAFLREVQNEVEESGGGLWDGVPFRYLLDDPPLVEINAETGLPALLAVATAVDPSGSARGDEVGIVTCGAFKLAGGALAGIVLEDASGQLSPAQWSQKAVNLHRKWQPFAATSHLLAESNFGGEMVEATIKSAMNAPRVQLIHVSRGKLIRAEPVLERYERGAVWHYRRLPNLEGQMKNWHPESGQHSPGALDACVIALTKLLVSTHRSGNVY